MNTDGPQPQPNQARRTPRSTIRRSHTLNVKDVPYEVWKRARRNAEDSDMSFGQYVIRLLSECTPFPPGEEGPATVYPA